MAPNARAIPLGEQQQLFEANIAALIGMPGGGEPQQQQHEDDAHPGDDSRKSERKRQRERQRRSDLAGAFDELAQLLTQVEPGGGEGGSESGENKRRRRRSSMSGGQDDAPLEDSAGMTRLDLIGRTIGVLRRLQQENADLRTRLMEGGGAEGEEKVRRDHGRLLQVS